MISLLSIWGTLSNPGTLKSLLFIAIGLAGVGFIIAFHELGHFLFCKLFGIRTPSFSVGFGPRLISKKIGDTLFSISLIPLGGYVEIAGTAEVGQGEQKEAHSRASDSFAVKPYYQKMLVMLGGILFNIMFAYVVFTALLASGIHSAALHYPHSSEPIIAQLTPEGPASQAGLQTGDRIVGINEIAITTNISPLINFIRNHPHEEVIVTLERNTTRIDLPVKLDANPASEGKIGVLGVTFMSKPLSFTGSLVEGAHVTAYHLKTTFLSILSLFKKKDISQMAGPLGILQLASKGAAAGVPVLLVLLALISVNLAILNLIPIPILDGGQMLVCTIEALTGRTINEKIKIYIHMACWIVFILLAVYLTWHDLKRIISPYFIKS